MFKVAGGAAPGPLWGMTGRPRQQQQRPAQGLKAWKSVIQSYAAPMAG